jgi:hypothetical protein
LIKSWNSDIGGPGAAQKKAKVGREKWTKVCFLLQQRKKREKK